MNASNGEPAERERFDVAIVGAGQAGLAMGHALARQGRRFVILEAAESVGAAWRGRWDSLVLFTPRRYALPGLAFPGEPDGYATRDEVIAYLESYAAKFELPVELNSEVRSLTRDEDGLVLTLDGERTILASQVVVATGAFQAPYVPPLGSELAPEVFQVHSTGYRRPGDIPGGTVLVVGGGNTGFQIAKELSATHSTHLAIGSRQKPLPQRLLGRDLFWWLARMGILDKTVETRIGQRLQGRDTLIGSSPRELKRRHGVDLRPRAVRGSGRAVEFADGGTLDVDAVIWATGYRPDHAWIELPIIEDGRLRHRRGVTDVPGLYFLGLTWQHTRGSALLGWVRHDAEFIAHQIAQTADAAAPRQDQPTGTHDAQRPRVSQGA